MTTGTTGPSGQGDEPGGQEPGGQGPGGQRPYARWVAAGLAAMAGFALVIALLQSDEDTVAGPDPTPSATPRDTRRFTAPPRSAATPAGSRP